MVKPEVIIHVGTYVSLITSWVIIFPLIFDKLTMDIIKFKAHHIQTIEVGAQILRQHYGRSLTVSLHRQ